jgi:cell wall-associated NlpC family hydrolase
MNLTNATKKFMGIKYILGGMDSANGLDCFSLIINYLRNIGYDIPEDLEFKGYNFKNYSSKYCKDPDIINIGYEYLSTFLKGVIPQKAIAGDILFAKLEDNSPSFGIDGGNGTMIIVSETGGVQIIGKKYYTILKALRCRK